MCESSYLYIGSAYCCLQLQPAEATYPTRPEILLHCWLWVYQWPRIASYVLWIDWSFYSTQNDWTLNPASSIGTQTPSAARLAAIQRLWWKAFIGGLVASHPMLTAFVVRPNKINYVLLRCIAGARLNGHEWTIKIVFMLCANDKLCKCNKLAVP